MLDTRISDAAARRYARAEVNGDPADIATLAQLDLTRVQARAVFLVFFEKAASERNTRPFSPSCANRTR